uniref:Uncharacterized protein n=1 Tax=Gorilla gorilla gorilla TaxID=9595 RepID=A0A2I2Y8G9_GORGO
MATSHFLHHPEPHLLPSPGVITLALTLFPLGVCDELPGEERWEPGQDRKLCLSFPLGTPARPIKSICPILLSLLFLSRGMEQRVREAVAISTSASAPSASEPFLSWGMGSCPLLFSLPVSLTNASASRPTCSRQKRKKEQTFTAESQ